MGKREIIYLSLQYHHQNDSCIKMGSEESHFNVSMGSDGHSHRTVSTNHNLFEEKGQPKRYRTEVLPLTNLTPYRQARPAHTALVDSCAVFKGCPFCKKVPESDARSVCQSTEKKSGNLTCKKRQNPDGAGSIHTTEMPV